MRACIWPGDRGRLARLEAALAAFFDAKREAAAPRVEASDASGFARRVDEVSRAHPDAFVLAYQSYLRDYLAPDVRDAYRTAMHAWLGALPAGRALWGELEIPPGETDRPEPAALIAHVRTPEGAVRTLESARTVHHPTVIRPLADPIRELERALGSWKSLG
jgi:hypothetical protein